MRCRCEPEDGIAQVSIHISMIGGLSCTAGMVLVECSSPRGKPGTHLSSVFPENMCKSQGSLVGCCGSVTSSLRFAGAPLL